MTVADLITTLGLLPQQAPVTLRTILPNRRICWDDIDRPKIRSRETCRFESDRPRPRRRYALLHAAAE